MKLKPGLVLVCFITAVFSLSAKDLFTVPVMTSTTSVAGCSGTVFNIAFTASIPSTFAWQVISTSGTLTGLQTGDTGTSFSKTIINPSSTTITAQISVVPTEITAPNDVGAAQIVTIAVYAAVIAPPQNVTSCSSIGTGLYLATTSATAVSYNVTARVVAPSLTVSASAIVPATNVARNYVASDKFTNLTTGQLSVTYTVVPVSADGCAGSSYTIKATINPEPVLSSSLNSSVCSSSQTGLILTTNAYSVAASSYNIISISNDAGLTAAPTNSTVANNVNASYLLNDKFINQTAGSLKAYYTIAPVSAAGCIGGYVVVTITIVAQPSVSSTLNETVCSSSNTGLVISTRTGSVGAPNYNIISVVRLAGLSSSAGNAVVPATGVPASYLSNDVFTNTTSTSGTVTYSVVPVAATGCQGTVQTVVVTVNPEPVLSTSLNATICSGQPSGIVLAVKVTSVAAASYLILSRAVSSGLTPLASSTVPASGVNTGYLSNDAYSNLTASALTVTYSIAGVSAIGCIGPAITVTVVVNPAPKLSAALNTAVCNGGATGVVLTTASGSAAASLYNILSSSLSAGITPVSVVSVPANNVSSSYISGDTYSNSTGSPLTVNYSIAPVTSVGCIGASTAVTITINAPQSPITSIDGTVCSESPIGLTLPSSASTFNVSNIDAPAGLSPKSSNATVVNTVSNNYISGDAFTNITTQPLDVIYTIAPVYSGGCVGSAFTATATINPQPVLSDGLDTEICAGVNTGLVLTTTASSVAASSFSFLVKQDQGVTAASGNASPANQIPANGLSNDNYSTDASVPLKAMYSVTPLSASGCAGAVAIVAVTIDPKPFASANLQTVCSGVPIGFTLSSANNSVAASSFNLTDISIATGITPGNANVVPENTVDLNYIKGDVYQNLTTDALNVVYSVVAISVSGCAGDSFNITEQINPQPAIEPVSTFQICSDSPLNLMLSAKTGSAQIANFNFISRTPDTGIVQTGAVATIPASDVAANYLANEQFYNPTASAANVDYSVNGVSAAGCISSTVLINVIISPSATTNSVAKIFESQTATGVRPGVNLTALYDSSNNNSNTIQWYTDNLLQHPVASATSDKITDQDVRYGIVSSGNSNCSSFAKVTYSVYGLPVTQQGTDITASSFTANWTSSGPVTKYLLDVSDKNDFSAWLPGFHNDIVTPEQQAVSVLEAQTNYYYRVRAVLVTGEVSAYSNITTVTTANNTVTGLEEQASLGIQVFPNPTAGHIVVKLDEPINQICIFSPQGALLTQHNAINSTQSEMSMEHYPSGVYLIMVTPASGKQYVRKLVKF